jgi:hypothetical protein
MISKSDLFYDNPHIYQKVISTKKEYFQGVSILGRDCILVKFILQSLSTFNTAAKLPFMIQFKF